MSLFCASGNLEENSFFPRPPGELESKDTLSSLDVPPLWSMSKALKAGMEKNKQKIASAPGAPPRAGESVNSVSH